jgi:hypothetical protein
VRRQSQVHMVRVAGRWARIERPAPGPKYDIYHLLGAAFGGAMVALLTLAILVRGV